MEGAPVEPDRASDPTSIVVWDAGRWSLTRLDARDPVEVALDDVLRWVEADVEVGDPLSGPAPDGAGAPWVRPAPPTALLVGGGGVSAFSSARPGLVQLSGADLRLLDQIHGPVRREDLDLPDEGAGLRRLAAHGLVELGQDQGPDRPGTPALDQGDEVFLREGDAWRTPLSASGRTPVLCAYVPQYGPPLALGMILALARRWGGGRLGERYDLRPPVTIDEARGLLADHTGPAVLMVSNYVWSLSDNLGLAADAKAANPEVLVVHGGPSTPKYIADQERFLALPGVDIAVVGEGEEAASEVLDALEVGPSGWSRAGLEHVNGIVYRAPGSPTLTRTPDRARVADLDQLPSPYLTGEFDDLHPATWDPAYGGSIVVETNRGCPYGCTFCDWGSATLSRIRKFSMERVRAEMTWLANHGGAVWMLADANVGILPRDVEIAALTAQLRTTHGVPHVLGINTAKNSTRHLPAILSTLSDAGIPVLSSLSLQTRDPDTLDAINRSNISTERYDQLGASFRALGLPLMCDLVVGLPGATVQSFKADLQWAFDHEVTARCWVLQLLPNAPMNAPEYRAEHGIRVDDEGVVIETSSYTEEERTHMMRLRMAHRVFEHYGILRHVLRHLQWDHGLPAMEVIDRLVTIDAADPHRYPLLSWVQRYLDYFLIPPVDWALLYDEVRAFARDDLGVAPDPAFETALAVQRAVMPQRGRSWPDTVHLDHDYVTYYHDATASLAASGSASGPSTRLADHGPGSLVIAGDPADIVRSGFTRLEETRPSDLFPRKFWHVAHLELDSPLTRSIAEVRANAGFGATRTFRGEPGDEGVPSVAPGATPPGADPTDGEGASVQVVIPRLRLFRRRRAGVG